MVDKKLLTISEDNYRRAVRNGSGNFECRLFGKPHVPCATVLFRENGMCGRCPAAFRDQVNLADRVSGTHRFGLIDNYSQQTTVKRNGKIVGDFTHGEGIVSLEINKNNIKSY